MVDRAVLTIVVQAKSFFFGRLDVDRNNSFKKNYLAPEKTQFWHTFPHITE